jgi:all-trans-8'-apo-beta-carotenal 15,15'-oxygenase
MEGRKGNYACPGKLRRYIIDPSAKRIREEVLHEGNFDFPQINLRHLCHVHRYGYLAEITGDEHFFTGISRIDTVSGKKQSFDFGSAVYCSEPLFVPRPGTEYAPGSVDEPGWVLVEVYDGLAGKGFLAIFDAESISSGPIAQAKLSHHVPLGFHGFWREEVDR